MTYQASSSEGRCAKAKQSNCRSIFELVVGGSATISRVDYELLAKCMNLSGVELSYAQGTEGRVLLLRVSLNCTFNFCSCVGFKKSVGWNLRPGFWDRLRWFHMFFKAVASNASLRTAALLFMLQYGLIIRRIDCCKTLKKIFTALTQSSVINKSTARNIRAEQDVQPDQRLAELCCIWTLVFESRYTVTLYMTLVSQR